MILRCLKCGESRRTRAKEPKRRPCPTCSGWLIPIGGKQIQKVAQQLFNCGFNIACADSTCFSFNPSDFGHKNCPTRLDAVWIKLGFGRNYGNEVFTELPEIFKESLELSGGFQILFSDNETQYKQKIGISDGASAEKALIEQLYSWAEWLEKSGMASILLLQGKL